MIKVYETKEYEGEKYGILYQEETRVMCGAKWSEEEQKWVAPRILDFKIQTNFISPWVQEVRSKEFTFRHYNYEITIFQELRDTKEIGIFKNTSDVINFFDIISSHFKNTRFEAIKEFIKNSSSYLYNVELDFQDSNCDYYENSRNHNKVSRQRLDIHGGDYANSLYYKWKTVSNHLVILEGYMSFKKTSETEVKIHIGTDESQNFYPKILEIVKEITG